MGALVLRGRADVLVLLLGSEYLVDLGTPQAFVAVKMKRRVVPVLDDVGAFLDVAGASLADVQLVGQRVGAAARALCIGCFGCKIGRVAKQGKVCRPSVLFGVQTH